MDRSEFIKKAQENNKMTDNDLKLIDGMKVILNYFHQIEQEVESPTHVENNMKVGGEFPDYPQVMVNLNKNTLWFKRENNKIEVTFVSSFNTEYSDKNNRLNVDNINFINQQLISEKYGLELKDNLLEQYLPYLLATHL